MDMQQKAGRLVKLSCDFLIMFKFSNLNHPLHRLTGKPQLSDILNLI